MSCCDVNGLNRLFRGSFVSREQRAFLKSGLNKRQRGFFGGLELQDKTVLDIGCGVGGLGLSALQRGATSAQLVDVSRGYLRAAREVAGRLEVVDRVSFLEGDFTHLDVKPADIVLLDRVVCCYPAAPALLRKAARHSRGDLVFTYPLPTWWLRAGRAIINRSLTLLRHPYRFYVHDEDTLLAAAASAGHAQTHVTRYGVWCLRVFKAKASGSGSGQ